MFIRVQDRPSGPNAFTAHAQNGSTIIRPTVEASRAPVTLRAGPLRKLRTNSRLNRIARAS